MATGLKIINGDFVINDSGSVETLLSKEKCARDLGKMLITEKENTSNETSYYRYNSTYGTDLNNQLNYQGLSRPMIKDIVTILVNQAITNYISLQEGRTNLSIDEIITGVNFTVLYNSEDLKIILIDIKYTTLASNSEQSLGQFVQNVG